MSILDQWEKCVVAFGRKTKGKVLNATEITRLRSLISGEEKNFKCLCTQLGEQYVRCHTQDYEPAFEELMVLCKASMDRTEGYRNEISAIRRVRTCPDCGAEVPLDFAFCNFCGAKLPQVEPVVPKGFVKCPGCGALIPETMKFCNHCGVLQPAYVAKEAEVFAPDPAAPQTSGEPGADAPAADSVIVDSEPVQPSENP